MPLADVMSHESVSFALAGSTGMHQASWPVGMQGVEHPRPRPTATRMTYHAVVALQVGRQVLHRVRVGRLPQGLRGVQALQRRRLQLRLLPVEGRPLQGFGPFAPRPWPGPRAFST